MVQELRKFLAPEFVFGVGARNLVAQYARQLGASRVLVVTDPGVIEAGWTAPAVEAMRAQNLFVEVFDEVTPNPRDHEVEAGAAVFLSRGCDFIVAIGGGSPIDCAKGIGTVAAHDRPILEFEGVDQLTAPIPPLICVPTTGGTGADVSQFAIIMNTALRSKAALVSKALVPDLSLVDPQTLTSMSRELTIASGMDVLCHAMEAFVSTAGWAFTDLHALAAARTINRHLHESVDDPDNLEIREKVMLASLQAGLAFSNAGLGMVHAMAHAAGGFHDTAHGESNAALLSPVMSWVLETVEPERVAQLADAFDQPGGVEEIVGSLTEINERLGLTSGLGAMGVTAADFPALAELASRDATLATSPRMPTLEEIVHAYERAL